MLLINLTEKENLTGVTGFGGYLYVLLSAKNLYVFKLKSPILDVWFQNSHLTLINDKKALV